MKNLRLVFALLCLGIVGVSAEDECAVDYIDCRFDGIEQTRHYSTECVKGLAKQGTYGLAYELARDTLDFWIERLGNPERLEADPGFFRGAGRCWYTGEDYPQYKDMEQLVRTAILLRDEDRFNSLIDKVLEREVYQKKFAIYKKYGHDTYKYEKLVRAQGEEIMRSGNLNNIYVKKEEGCANLREQLESDLLAGVEVIKARGGVLKDIFKISNLYRKNDWFKGRVFIGDGCCGKVQHLYPSEQLGDYWINEGRGYHPGLMMENILYVWILDAIDTVYGNSRLPWKDWDLDRAQECVNWVIAMRNQLFSGAQIVLSFHTEDGVIERNDDELRKRFMRLEEELGQAGVENYKDWVREVLYIYPLLVYTLGEDSEIFEADGFRELKAFWKNYIERDMRWYLAEKDPYAELEKLFNKTIDSFINSFK